MEFIKRFRYWIALVILVVPILLRGLWFYQGIPFQPKIKAPNYAANTIPQPPTAKAPTEQAAATKGKVVVVDDTHDNQFVPNQIDSFFNALTQRGARLEIDSGALPLEVRLKYASTYIVFSPTAAFSSDEVNAVRNFVESGGRLVVFTDPTHGIVGTDWNTGMLSSQPDVDSANQLLAPYGLSLRNDYLYDLVKNEGNFRNVLFTKFDSNTITAGLTEVAFYGVHSVSYTDGTALISGDPNTYSSQTDSAGAGMAAAVMNAAGNVLALGDFSFLMTPYDTVADNSLLIDRIADFSLGGSRTHGVANFPYVFDRTVYTIPTGGLQMTADFLGPLANLQTSLQATNTTLLVRPEAPADGDLLVIGSLTPSDDLSPYIASFALNLDNPTTITIPEFGTVDRNGVGLLLYTPSASRNVLVLLTDTPEDLPSMVELLASGSLDSCVFQGEVGVCSIGSGGNYYTRPTLPDFPLETPTSEPSRGTPASIPGG